MGYRSIIDSLKKLLISIRLFDKFLFIGEFIISHNLLEINNFLSESQIERKGYKMNDLYFTVKSKKGLRGRKLSRLA